MDMDTAIRRSQLYRFLACAFLYPDENWLEEAPWVADIAQALGAPQLQIDDERLSTDELQAEHRRVFGLTGSLCYETEYGLPHEFRQSQELADIAGFYRAFGFVMGGPVRERPDHLAAELEFMHALALKEAYALHNGAVEHAEICAGAQRVFIEGHLGQWIDLFAQSLAHNAHHGPYLALARFAAGFVADEAGRLGAHIEPRRLADVQHTPVVTEFSCGDCPVAEGLARE